MKQGICHICGVNGDLTYEHVPPKSAFNGASNLLSYGFDKQQRAWVPTTSHPYGVGEYTLCASCNNNTGGIYGQAFCDFVSVIAESTKDDHSYREPIAVSYTGYLHRILKQIVVMFCTANGEQFSARNGLAEYLLNFGSMNFPDKMRVYLLLVHRRSNISTGLQGALNLKTNHTILASEILFWPLGYVLAYDDLLADGIAGAHLTEVTDWKTHPTDQKVKADLILYRNYRLTMFPMDFRSKAEIEATSGEPIKPPLVLPFIDYEL
jgi:hypothetical protein